jgi:hypothetical protein
LIEAGAHTQPGRPEPVGAAMAIFDRDPRIPLLSVAFGFGPSVLMALAAAGAWLLPPRLAVMAIFIGWLWAAAILLFLAGVARGMSFATGTAPDMRQVVRSIALFVLGFGALASPLAVAFPLLALGHALVALVDPGEARADRAPAHFARLRPPQQAIAVAALASLALRVWLPA